MKKAVRVASRLSRYHSGDGGQGGERQFREVVPVLEGFYCSWTLSSSQISSSNSMALALAFVHLGCSLNHISKRWPATLTTQMIFFKRSRSFPSSSSASPLF